MRIKNIGLCCLLVLALGAGCSLKDSPKKETKKKQDQLQEVELSAAQKKLITSYAQDFASGDIEALRNNYTYSDKMMDVLKEDSFASQLADYRKAFGKLKKTETPYGQQYQGSTAVFLPCKMEKQDMTLQLSLAAKDTIQGLFFKPYKANPVDSTSSNLPKGIKETALNLKVSDTLTLPGKLTLPAKGSHFAVVVLVAGSGPNDMDETIGGNKPFQDIAYDLAKQGIAVYRYDKRTLVSPSSFTAKDTVKKEVMDDAIAAISLMKRQKVIDGNRIYVLGHSLGGYLMPRIAEETKDVAGYILMAASARPLPDIFMEQIQYLANLDGNVTKDEKTAIAQYQKDYDDSKHLKDCDDSRIFFGGMSKAYMKDLASYDPIQMAESITQPVLVAQGERDYQVTMKDFKRWKDAYGQKANWSFVTYPKANHLMINGRGKANPAEYEQAGHVNADFIKDLVKFVK